MVYLPNTWFVKNNIYFDYKIYSICYIAKKATEMNKRIQFSYESFITIYFLMVLRLISFCCDRIDFIINAEKKEKNESQFNFRNFIAYSFFPSFLTHGIFLPFKMFLPCVNFPLIIHIK